MANNPIAPTRKELAAFIEDERTIRAFEEIFAVLEENIEILNVFNNIITLLQQAPSTVSAPVQEGADVKARIFDTTFELISSNRDLTDYADVQNAQINNGPVAGNATKWVAINDNGTLRYIPTWHS